MYSHSLTTDNSTVTTVSMGSLGGGALNAVAFVEVDGEVEARKEEEGKEEEEDDPSASLVIMLSNRETGKLELVQKRTRKKGG